MANKLTLNTTKDSWLITESRYNLTKIQTNLIITIGHNNIKRISKLESLGVIIDDQLNWKDNVHSVCKKTSKGIGILRSVNLLFQKIL